MSINMISLKDSRHISVCPDGKGSTQIAHVGPDFNASVGGLTAAQCEQLARAFASEAARQDREAVEDRRMRDFNEALRADERAASPNASWTPANTAT